MCAFLAPFYHITNLISESSYPTSNLYFMQVYSIEKKLNENLYSEDEVIKDMVARMKVKFDKYWSEYSVCHALTPAWAKIWGTAWYWDFLTCFSNIGELVSINKSINKTSSTTTVVVFKMSCTYTCLSLIYLYLYKFHYYKNFTFTL